MIQETVTISLEHYNEMQAELSSLRRQVDEKTIAKYQTNPIHALIFLVILIAIACFGRYLV